MESIVFEKVTATLLITKPIIVLTKLSGDGPSSIYVRKEKNLSGLIVGVAAFAIFVISAVPTATSIFNAQNINSSVILVWAPWILVFVFANARAYHTPERFLLSRAQSLRDPYPRSWSCVGIPDAENG
jgi:hypothetical protein